MATVTTDRRADGIVGSVCGHFTSDNAAQTITLGFIPNYMKVVNETDSIVWEHFASMTAANSVKTTGVPAVTVDTDSAITFNSDGTVTLSATLVGNAKAIKFWACR